MIDEAGWRKVSSRLSKVDGAEPHALQAYVGITLNVTFTLVSMPSLFPEPSQPRVVEPRKNSAPWISAHCDGGARGNPGPSGYGALIQDEAGLVLAELSEFLGVRTNNFAEYSGLLGCLQWALDNGYKNLRVVSDSELGEQLYFLRNAVGSAPGPFDAWLTLRGAKTLAVRMDRHCQNAQRIADMLVSHSAVSEVYYPGLPAHPGHEIAAKQMRGFGGMVSFRARAGVGAAVEICGRTRLFTLGESLGGVESLIELPARMTHASVAGSELEVPADLVRLSVGIESVDDLIEDLDTALG